jgi:hypothetical protein
MITEKWIFMNYYLANWLEIRTGGGWEEWFFLTGGMRNRGIFMGGKGFIRTFQYFI